MQLYYAELKYLSGQYSAYLSQSSQEKPIYPSAHKLFPNDSGDTVCKSFFLLLLQVKSNYPFVHKEFSYFSKNLVELS